MEEVDKACLSILAGFKLLVEKTGDMNPTVVALYPEIKRFNTTIIENIPHAFIMDTIGLTVQIEKTAGASTVVIGHTAWMAMQKIKDINHPEDSVPKNYQHGDIAKMPDKKEVLVTYRLDLKTKVKHTVLWEIRRLGKKVEFQKMMVPTVFKSRVLDNIF